MYRSDVNELSVCTHPASTADLALYRDNDFGSVGGVAFDEAAGLAFVSETSRHRIHAVSVVDPSDEATWTIEVLAGDTDDQGSAGFVDGAAASALFREPSGLLYRADTSTLYVADRGNHVLRVVDLSGGVAAATVSTLAGTPETLGFHGDGGTASAALLHEPSSMTLCKSGDLFIADTGNNRVRRIDTSGIISTVIGDGVATSVGEGAPATSYSVNEPIGLGCDSAGSLFVNSTTTVRMLAADAEGIVDGSGPVRTVFGAPPSQDAIGMTSDIYPASITRCLTGLILTEDDRVWVTDACQGLLMEVASTTQ